MAGPFEALARFRSIGLSGKRLAGTFQKTPSRHVGEILARSGLDFSVLDAEHAPFGIEAIDDILASARPSGFPVLVRVPELRAPFIGACLDAGAAGIVVPHVTDAAKARAAVAAVRFAAGGRGLSPSGRAGDYGGQTLADYMQDSDAAVSLWCQIEDAEAVDDIASICAVPGIDALFVGRADLMRSLGGATLADAVVERAVARVAEAGVAAGRRLAIFIAAPAEAERFAAMGFSIFICGSDQSFLKAQAQACAQAIVPQAAR